MLKELNDFLGNERLVGLLLKKPLPPATLFAGPDGVGKKTLALLLARSYNCKDPQQGEACDRCGSCIKSAAASHPDIRLYLPEANVIRIAAMRELSREAFFRPFEGRKRFFIIDEAEKMSEEAANSILKTLEEPPDTSCIVLISAFPQRLLPTIRSRCQTFVFQSLTRQQIADYLGRQGETGEIEIRAAFSGGSLGKALSLDLKLTLEERDRILQLLQIWIENQSFLDLHRKLEEEPLRRELKDRDQLRKYLQHLELLVQDLYFLLVETPDRVTNRDRMDSLESLYRDVTIGSVRKFLEEIAKTRREVDRYLNPVMCFETLWLSTSLRST